MITHVAVSNDGSGLVTAELARDELDLDTSTLRFWHRVQGTQGGEWVPDTVAWAPHKQGLPVGALAYAPTQHAVVSTAPSRSFKLWVREADEEEAKGLKLSTLTVSQRDRLRRRSDRARQLAKKAGLDQNKAAHAAEKDEMDRLRQKKAADSIRWSCRSQCYWRDLPIGGASFSGDGAVLAVSYGPSITLWAPMASTLLAVLSPPTAGNALRCNSALSRPGLEWLASTPAGAALEVWEGECQEAGSRIRHACFLPDSPFVVAATVYEVQLWDVRACELQWTFDISSSGGGDSESSQADFVVSCVAPERFRDQFTGHARTSRFAVVCSAAQPTVEGAAAYGLEAASSSEAGSPGLPSSAGVVMLFEATSPAPVASWPVPASDTAPISRVETSPLRRGLSDLLNKARDAAAGNTSTSTSEGGTADGPQEKKRKTAKAGAEGKKSKGKGKDKDKDRSKTDATESKSDEEEATRSDGGRGKRMAAAFAASASSGFVLPHCEDTGTSDEVGGEWRAEMDDSLQHFHAVRYLEAQASCFRRRVLSVSFLSQDKASAALKATGTKPVAASCCGIVMTRADGRIACLVWDGRSSDASSVDRSSASAIAVAAGLELESSSVPLRDTAPSHGHAGAQTLARLTGAMGSIAGRVGASEDEGAAFSALPDVGQGRKDTSVLGAPSHLLAPLSQVFGEFIMAALPPALRSGAESA